MWILNPPHVKRHVLTTILGQWNGNVTFPIYTNFYYLFKIKIGIDALVKTEREPIMHQNKGVVLVIV